MLFKELPPRETVFKVHVSLLSGVTSPSLPATPDCLSLHLPIPFREQSGLTTSCMASSTLRVRGHLAVVENAAWAEAVGERIPNTAWASWTAPLARSVWRGPSEIEGLLRAGRGRERQGEAGQGSGALSGCGLVCSELLKLFKRLSYWERCRGSLTWIWMGHRSALPELGSNREEPRADLTGGESGACFVLKRGGRKAM